MCYFTPTQTMFGNDSLLIYNKINFVLFRSALDDAREINHHGMTVKVGGGEEEEQEELTLDGPENAFDKNLISRDERTQDAAMKYVWFSFAKFV